MSSRASTKCDEGSINFNKKTKEKLVGRNYYVYILTDKNNKTMYVGQTNDLERRLYEHKHKLVDGFTKRYNVDKLVYYEVCESVMSTIEREKEIKGWRREKKNRLVESVNPDWKEIQIDEE